MKVLGFLEIVVRRFERVVILINISIVVNSFKHFQQVSCIFKFIWVKTNYGTSSIVSLSKY